MKTKKTKLTFKEKVKMFLIVFVVFVVFLPFLPLLIFAQFNNVPVEKNKKEENDPFCHTTVCGIAPII